MPLYARLDHAILQDSGRILSYSRGTLFRRCIPPPLKQGLAARTGVKTRATGSTVEHLLGYLPRSLSTFAT